jgi:hypothetical protein
VFLALGAAFAFGVFVAGCESASRLRPNGRAVVPVQARGDELPTTKVKLGNEVVIQLPELDTPGTAWTIVFNDVRFLDQLRPIEASPGGGFTASFLAIHTGRRPLRFLAIPIGVREATPTQSYDLVVEIE